MWFVAAGVAAFVLLLGGQLNMQKQTQQQKRLLQNLTELVAGQQQALQGQQQALQGQQQALQGQQQALINITERMASQENHLQNIAERMASQENHLQNVTRAVEAIEKQVGTIKEQVKFLFDLAHDKVTSLELAKKCSVRLRVWPKENNNDVGSGTLVLIDGERFVLTSRHIIIKKKKGKEDCVRKLVSVFRQGGDSIPAKSFSHALVSTREDVDLALIPVLIIDKHPVEFFCTVSESKVKLHEEVVAFLPAKNVDFEQAFNAYIREMAGDAIVAGTFGGTNGHSGLGYFANERVMLVHKGAEKYKGSRRGMEFSDEFDFDWEYADMSKGERELAGCFGSNGTINGIECAQNFTSHMGLIARNPLAKAVPANLSHNRSLFVQVSANQLSLCKENE